MNEGTEYERDPRRSEGGTSLDQGKIGWISPIDEQGRFISTISSVRALLIKETNLAVIAKLAAHETGDAKHLHWLNHESLFLNMV